MKIQHILLSTDLSPESLAPCAPVVQLARDHGARITLLHVVPQDLLVPAGAPLAPPIIAPATFDHVREAEENLSIQAKELDAEVRIESCVESAHSIPDAIEAWAEKHDVDLIAISTHGRTGWRHLALGSVAEAVLRRSKIPVLCFPRPKKK